MIRRGSSLLFLTAAAVFGFPNPDSGCSITTSPALAPATTGIPVTYTIATAGCATPFRLFQKSTGTLPAGLAVHLDSSGLTISGTPTAAGVFAFSLRVIDANYRIPSKSLIIQVNDPLQFDTPAAATGVAGQAYSDVIRLRGGAAPYTFSIVEGALPSGIALSPSTGALSGTMPSTGSQFRVRVTDSSANPQIIERPYTIFPGGQIIATPPPAGSTGTAYNFDIDGTLGATGFALALGALPPGLTMDGNGLIGGSPTAVGEYHFTVRQTAGVSSVWRSFRILVNSAGTIAGTPRDAEESFAYENVFTVNGGVAPYTFSVSAGTLPTGITLQSGTGALIGELPVGSPGGSFTISAVDASGRTYSQAFSITRQLRLTGSSSTPPKTRVSVSGSATPYSLSTGGTSKNFLQIGGPGQGNVTINPSSGSTTYLFDTAGVFTPVVLGSDNLGGAVVFNSTTYTVVAPLAINTANELPNALEGSIYSASVSVANGDFTPLVFSLSSGSLPAGLVLNTATGAITGTLSYEQSSFAFPFTISVTDAAGQSNSRDFYIGVNYLFSISSVSVPSGTTGTPYTATLTQNGGYAPYWWIPESGLPPGLVMSTAGVISGTPTTVGTYTFDVQLQDYAYAESNPDLKRFTIRVSNPLTASISPASPLEATVGTSTSPQVTTGGGRAPFTLSAASAAAAAGLPDGLFFKHGALAGIRGVPQIPELTSRTITVTDADGRTASFPYSMNIREPVQISTATLAAPTRNAPYSQSLVAIGGLAPYSWSLGTGFLPPGVTLASNGSLSGTPTSNGSFSFIARAQDTTGRAVESSYSVTVADPLSITNSVPLPSAVVLNPYSVGITTTGGATTKTFSISSGDLPPLTAINPSTGAISNLPLAPGVYNFTISAVDSGGRAGVLGQRISVQSSLGISPPTLPDGTVGSPYSQSLTATNASGSVGWSVISGALPAGISLGPSNGLLSGTPTAPGTANFTVQAMDSSEQSVTKAYSLRILDVLTISPATLPDGTIGSPYSQTLTSANASGTATWSVITGSLPAGISLNSASGTMSGTPTASGTSNFTIQVTDSQSQLGTRAYSLRILSVLTVSPATLPDGTIGASYSQTLTANGSGSTTWSVTTGSLPAGISLNATSGALSGIPTAAGTSSFTVQALDSIGQRGSRAYTLRILDVLAISPATLPDGTAGTLYGQTLTAASSNAVAWSVVLGSLPNGLSLGASTGQISGTPTVAGSATFTVQALDSQGQRGTREYVLQILDVLVITPTSLPDGAAGSPYSQTLTAAPATGAVTWGITSGSLPPGISLGSGNGQLSGTPTTPGLSTFTVQAVDSRGQRGVRSLTLRVNDVLVLSPSSLPNGTKGTAYSQAISATPVEGSVAWSISSGSLPAGLSLGASTGLLSGTPSAAGLYSFTVQATDAQGQRGISPYSLRILDVLTIGPSQLPDAILQTSYNQALTATPASGTVNWTLTSGSLPPGLSLGATTGVLSGTPTSAGTSTFTVQAADSGGQIGSQPYSLTVLDVLAITPGTLANATIGSAYSQTFAVGSAVGAVAWSVASGTLPAGVTLASQSGVLSGTPTASGTFDFVVKALDSRGQMGTRSVSLRVLDVLSISPATLPKGTTGTAYTQTLTAAPATGAITWTVSIGSLPAGLTLGSSSGILSGNPTKAGTYTFTVQATDSLGQTGSQAYSLQILSVLAVAPATIPNGTVGTPYSQSFSVTPADGAATWTLSAGAIPAGLTLNGSNGLLSGTPTTAGPASFTVQATDSQGQVGTQAYSISITSALGITTATLPDATEKEAYSVTIVVDNPAGSAITWSVTAGTLPAGLTLNSATGVISGVPTTRGTYPLTLQAAPASGLAATKAYSLLVVGELIITATSLGEAPLTRLFSTTLSASGGRAPFTWTLTGSTLPAGLTLNPATGAISGTPTGADGPYPQNVTVTDVRGRTATKSLPFSVVPAPPPSLTLGPDTLPNGRVGQVYSASLNASGGTPGYTFTVSAGAPPTGVTLRGSQIEGTPTQEGTYRFTINATDSQGRVAGNSYVVVIEAALLPLSVTPSALKQTALLAQPYSAQFGATGGKAPYSFTLSGSTPPGTSFNSSGLLSGTPSQGGSFGFSVEATDALQNKASRSYTLTVSGGLAISTRPPVADGTVGAAYAFAFGATGGTPSYAWTATGTTPPGLRFDGATGSLEGTPTTPGTFTFAVEVQDAQKATASGSFSITIYDRLEITAVPGETPSVAGEAFTFTFPTKGGKAPVAFSITGGNLPPGLLLASSGTISGRPTSPGEYSFTVRALDALGIEAVKQAKLTVVAPVTISTTSLPDGTVDGAYQAGLTATGGVAPLGTWSVSQGNLPAGLTLNPDGTISGTPTKSETATFTVRVSDAAGTVTTRQLSITIALPPVPPVVLGGLPQALPPGTQSNVTIQLAKPYPTAVFGTLTLVFEPNAVNNADDPAVQFSSGGRTVTFTIPAGETSGVFPVPTLRINSGTVAGTLRIRTTTNPESATPVPETTLPLARSIPVISSGTAQLGSGTFTVTVDGFSNTRELSSATFRLTPAAGAPLATTEVQVPVASVFTAWYQSSTAAPFGGQFRLTLPFNVSGLLSDIDSVTVTVTNAVGTSEPYIIRLR